MTLLGPVGAAPHRILGLVGSAASGSPPAEAPPGLPSVPLRRWWRAAVGAILSVVNFLVFAFLDLADLALCFFFRIADDVIEGKSSPPCYCWSGGRGKENQEEEGVSETLYGRRNIFWGIRLVRSSSSSSSLSSSSRKEGRRSPRWSDCCCQTCISWTEKGEEKLHLVLREPPTQDTRRHCSGSSTEDIIFLHGFLSSSSLWAETVFPNLSAFASENCRLFAVDLLGFGKSPKPGDRLYTLKDHVEMIEKTVINPFQLGSFHLVAHSMGCIIALAIAERHPGLVKSVSLVAPPCFSSGEVTSHTLLRRLAPKEIWPPGKLGVFIMSWYEHLGRSICFIVCRYHTKWEWILRLLTKRDLNFKMVDLTKHTHHSAWHTMHNVICGVAKSTERFLEALSRSGVPACLIHGSEDRVVPVECGYAMKLKVPHLDLRVISGADHSSVITGRERDFTADLERFWFSSAL
ncbi:unnamed protein product [Spirodela intermedia]|uniref:AB hydrolase-1 domain-containing protein n=1 Tax=Spirodela intermedia TaxID=51605 RepID=A0A7I8IY42_SPIIN|nr:unnamed protein product [Spirodela intermedia]CAA6661921.1 unnamed protein product [Spirodela intermedia]